MNIYTFIMHYFSKYFLFLFPTVILGTFFTNGETPFCNTSIFHIVKGSFCTFVTERSAYMEMFILGKTKKVEWFQYILFSIMLFIHFSAEKSLQLSAHLCWCDFRCAEERPKSIALLVLAFLTLDVFQSIWSIRAWREKERKKEI